MAHVWRGVLREYADRLGVTDASTVITLGEGGTPLLPAPALSRRTGADVWVKFEGMNPTGSFKDRGMTVARLARGRARREGDHLRLDRQHVGVGRGLRRARRHHRRRARARGQDRDGQAQPGRRAQRAAHPDAAATSTTASRSPASSPTTTRCTW